MNMMSMKQSSLTRVATIKINRSLLSFFDKRSLLRKKKSSIFVKLVVVNFLNQVLVIPSMFFSSPNKLHLQT